MSASSPRSASVYRMVMPGHICPFGLKARHLLRRKGFDVDDHWLRSRPETDAFMAEQHVKSTPQVFIEGQRIGGYDDLRRHFGFTVRDPQAPSYRPVIAVFGVSLLMAGASLAASGGAGFDGGAAALLQRFIAFSMCVLALLKLQDVESFSTMFLNYDLLARQAVPYAYIYPFAELLAGVLMVARAWPAVSAPVALFVGTVGAISVFKAVYIDKRALKCACVGGGSSVPLGFVSLTENLMMVGMGVWTALAMARP